MANMKGMKPLAGMLDKATQGLGGKKKKRKLQMHIKPTDDNRFHVMHNYSGPETMDSSEQSSEHAPSSLEELLAHVKQHYSDAKAEPEGDASEKA